VGLVLLIFALPACSQRDGGQASFGHILRGAIIMRKNSPQRRRPSTLSSDSLDQLLYAVAFVLARRQMRAKWASPLRASTSALA
jgi:hypothetical protein